MHMPTVNRFKTFVRKIIYAKGTILFACAFAALLCALLRPSVAAKGVLSGLSLCYHSIIPALFPFLVLLQLVLSGRAAQYLGLPLAPYIHLLGVRNSKAATALLLGLLGGFCGGAQAVQTLYEQDEISSQEAALLLCPATNSGLGFVVSGVGAVLLHSAPTGWLLFCALSLASLCTGLLCRAAQLAKSPHQSNQRLNVYTNGMGTADTHSSVRIPAKASALNGLVAAIQKAVSSTLMLCGFVVAFSFLTAILSPANGASLLLYGIAFPLEVTSACAAAAQSGISSRAFLCCAALSCTSLSVFAQIRALLSPAISLGPLAFSRLFHLPLSLLLFWGLLRLFPGVLSVGTAYTFARRMPYSAMTVMFLLCATFFCIFPTRKITM